MSFKHDFFSKNIPQWEIHLGKFKDTPATALELGSLEGQSAVWLLTNILTSPNSELTCIDLKVLPALRENLAPFAGRVTIIEADATRYAEDWTLEYDIIYIDAHHIAKDVIMQAGLLWPQLKQGGVMIFDDYGHKDWTVKPAVDFFMEHWKGWKLLHRGWQVILTKP